MRWTIRNQIVVPLVIVQSLAIAGAAAVTAEVAARSAERRVVERINGVLGVLNQSSFPHTDAVLLRMAGLSGAEFLALDAAGRVFARSHVGLDEAIAVKQGLRPSSALRDAPTMEAGGQTYRVLDGGPAQGRDGSLLVLYPEVDRQRARREAAWPPLALGALALALMVGWTGWTAQRISRRLVAVARQVARIAEGLPVGIDVRGPRDEVDDLARSVERMGADLRRFHDQTRRSDRARLLAQLGAGLAHQMRNALTGARISLQLHARRFPACATEPALGVALRQLDLSEAQLRGLLSIGRVPEGGSTNGDLVAASREVTELLGPSFEHANVKLSQETNNLHACPVIAPPAELRDVALNLTINALEASPPGGSVTLRIIQSNNKAALEVLDDGPGPPDNVADSLFDDFVTTKPEGLGLGLAVARRMAESSGGRLSWDRLEGRTRFRLELPTRRDA